MPSTCSSATAWASTAACRTPATPCAAARSMGRSFPRPAWWSASTTRRGPPSCARCTPCWGALPATCSTNSSWWTTTAPRPTWAPSWRSMCRPSCRRTCASSAPGTGRASSAHACLAHATPPARCWCSWTATVR
uniref:Putative alternative protein nipa1 n=1 Tax=Ixodes ricinus TaxID=34613 RepID=A0A147BS72_IXORI